jgi:antitoxin MazE
MTIKTRLVRIGNSQGIRLPKAVLEQCGLRDAVELEPRDGELVIRPAGHPRAGWDDAFRRMSAADDDKLLDEPVETDWDREDWVW